MHAVVIGLRSAAVLTVNDGSGCFACGVIRSQSLSVFFSQVLRVKNDVLCSDVGK